MAPPAASIPPGVASIVFHVHFYRLTTTDPRASAARAAFAWPPLAVVCLVGLLAGCSNAKSLNGQGVAYYTHGHYDYALSAFQQAQAQDPKNPNVYYNIARVYHQKGLTSGDRAQMQQAESYYHLCLDRDPHGDHRDCYRALAVLLVETDRSESAFTLLKGWAARYPAAADPRIELARLYEEHNEFDLAKERLLEALAIEPNNPRALAALGKVRELKARRLAADGRRDEEQRELAQAISDYRRSLAVDKTQTDVAARVAVLQTSHPHLDSRVIPPDGRRLVSEPVPRTRPTITPRY
jgi:tetratricopeptide (TPR) repeat protein